MKRFFSSGVFLCPILAITGTPSFSQDSAPPWPDLKPVADSTPLPGTQPLTMDGDISLKLAEGCDRFLDAQISRSAKTRPEPDRETLGKLLGLDRDVRPERSRFQYISYQNKPRARSGKLDIYQVRWLAFGDVHGEGLLLLPKGKIAADVIAIPDAGQSPEQISGLTPGAPPFALNLALSGCRVLVPTLIDREINAYRMTNREWLHRPAFILGRTLPGYELHKILAGVDCLKNSRENLGERRIAVCGYGEGGLLALYAGALNESIDVTGVSGYFGSRETLWNEPADHNIFGLLEHFGDAEIASLIAPRKLILSNNPGPDFVFGADESGEPMRSRERTPINGKPGKFISGKNFEAETRRITKEVNLITTTTPFETVAESLTGRKTSGSVPHKFTEQNPDLEKKSTMANQIAEIERHNQLALISAAADRAEYFKDLDTKSLETFQKTIEPYRQKFRTDVIGDFGLERLPFNARSRKYQEGPKTVSYEVVLDVFDDVIAYGILTLPKDLDLASGEKRPVVVCQHGLEGTPQDVIGEAKFKAYSAFATRLAERGFITFAPQNNYKYFDLFRIQQFKAQSIGKTLFSIIVPSHHQITDWLAARPFVDGNRIAFYGLSYGGKSAMRIPPLVENYCLSICSADFNEWVWKNAATDSKSLRYSYANKGEYEIFEWNLGGTFNYAEMGWLMAPRPFMVERGHFDGVAPDETVAYEFAKIRNLYAAKLGIGDRVEIEWFPGPHSINGVGTFDFLHRHLNWPAPE